MAIVSISRLQQRRGLLADLPVNLNEAEFGWCLDTRQLFIGNGNTYTGNSQVLTQWSPNDQIITHTYQGGTGVAAQGTVPRELGSILDDSLNVKDFGAVGDGITDDTAAIQQAIADQWARIAANPLSSLSARNVINFPAGTYVVSDTINLYPYITLSGEGPEHTAIKLSIGAAGPVFRTADSLGQTGSNIGLNGAILPRYITLSNIRIDCSNSNSNQALLLQRCSYISVISVSIIASWKSGIDPNAASGGILIESLGSSAFTTTNFSFIDMAISQCSYGLLCSDSVQRIIMNTSQIKFSYYGCQLLGGSSGPRFVNFTQNFFQNITSYGIEVATFNRGVTSVSNSFQGVGNSTVPAIYWAPGSSTCSSIADLFDNTNRIYRIYNGQPDSNLVFGAQQTEVVQNTPTPLLVTLLPNQTGASTGINYNLVGSTTFTIQIPYSVTMGTYRRGGTLYVISDGSTAQLNDQYVSLNASVTISFAVTVSSGQLRILYTSTGSSAGTMKYITTTWQF